MNSPEQAREFYKKMLLIKGEFTLIFLNDSAYKGVRIEDGKFNWDEVKGVGSGEIDTKTGRLYFELSQIKELRVPKKRWFSKPAKASGLQVF